MILIFPIIILFFYFLLLFIRFQKSFTEEIRDEGEKIGYKYRLPTNKAFGGGAYLIQ